ncbi:MAG: hypothetical protein AAF889_00580 [Cyanobacteria bacterium P01_D01_bin.73]
MNRVISLLSLVISVAVVGVSAYQAGASQPDFDSASSIGTPPHEATGNKSTIPRGDRGAPSDTEGSGTRCIDVIS